MDAKPAQPPASNTTSDDALWNQSLAYSAGFLGLVIAVMLVVKGHHFLFSIFFETIRRKTKAPPVLEDTRETRQAIANMYGLDTNFKLDLFYNRVRHAYEIAQFAIFDSRPQDARPFISDGIHERIVLQQAEQKDQGRSVRLQSASVRDCKLCEAAYEGSFEHASVRILAQITQMPADAAPNQSLKTAPSPVPVTEIWTFLRRRGAGRHVRKGLMEGCCPNCAAPLGMNQHSKCLSCGALLRSGEFDWVLVEISKDCAWERSPLFDVAGAEILQQRDPHLNIALLEDRASVMFWRWLTAIRMGRTDPIRKSATEACCQRVLKPLSDGLYYRNADVDSVRTRGFIPGKETDSALVEVRWNASVARRGEPANTAPLREVVTRSLVVLERKHDAKSEIANGFGSAHCPHCGAPETISPDPGCAYCGAMMNDGAVSWALSDLMPMSSNEAIRLLATAREQDKDLNAFAYGRRATETPFASVQPQPAQKTFAAQALCRAELLAWTIMTARADGNISQSEREFIMLLALRCGVPLERIEMLWRAETLEASSPRDRGEAMAWLQELARLSLVDGQLSEKETASLVLLAQRAGLNEPEARVTISRMRSQLYDQMPIDLKAQWNKPAGT